MYSPKKSRNKRETHRDTGTTEKRPSRRKIYTVMKSSPQITNKDDFGTALINLICVYNSGQVQSKSHPFDVIRMTVEQASLMQGFVTTHLRKGWIVSL